MKSKDWLALRDARGSRDVVQIITRAARKDRRCGSGDVYDLCVFVVLETRRQDAKARKAQQETQP